jgi:hypothetical protein
VLLEALIALAMLAAAAMATYSLAQANAFRSAQLIDRGRALRGASAFMDAVALWTRSDLDLRLGTRQQGPYLLRVTRVTPTLYALDLLDGASYAALLSTAVFRAEDVDARK